MKTRVRPAVLALSLALCACTSGPSSTDVMTTGLVESFEGYAVGAVPSGFSPAETNGKGTPARWAVADGGHAGGVRSLRVSDVVNEGDTYNLLLSGAAYPADLAIDVRLRADAGEEDQGGGLLWRARGPRDYYIARWNPLEDNVRIYKVKDGVRTQFASAKVVVPPGQWHHLAVTMQGDHARVAFDGKPLLDVHDATFAGPGRVGLWTKADAAVSFDDLSVKLLAP